MDYEGLMNEALEDMRHGIEVGSVVFQFPQDEKIIASMMVALNKQIPKLVALNHKVGDEVASVICPCCGKFTIIELEEHDEFDKDWYCEQCGQYLTLEEDEDNDFVEDFIPNCCDCEWTYNGGECDNCEWE